MTDAPTEDLIARRAQGLVQALAPDQGETTHPAFGLAVRVQNDLRALQQEVARLREACVAIQNLEHTEDNEWDAVETVIPAMVAVATKALTRISTNSDCAPLQSR